MEEQDLQTCRQYCTPEQIDALYSVDSTSPAWQKEATRTASVLQGSLCVRCYQDPYRRAEYRQNMLQLFDIYTLYMKNPRRYQTEFTGYVDFLEFLLSQKPTSVSRRSQSRSASFSRSSKRVSSPKASFTKRSSSYQEPTGRCKQDPYCSKAQLNEVIQTALRMGRNREDASRVSDIRSLKRVIGSLCRTCSREDRSRISEIFRVLQEYKEQSLTMDEVLVYVNQIVSAPV